jgi:hypothetical protein
MMVASNGNCLQTVSTQVTQPARIRMFWRKNKPPRRRAYSRVSVLADQPWMTAVRPMVRLLTFVGRPRHQ